MKLSDIIKSLLIIGIFGGIYMYSLLILQFKHIEDNWPKYRCNPAIMPFADSFGHDSRKNFSECIQTSQGNYMGHLLTPLHYITSILGSTVSGVITDINTVRKRITSLVKNVMSVVNSIFGIFINIIIQFQRMIIKIKDLVGKLIGTMMALIYIMQGGMLAGTSIMAGPIGDTLRFVKTIG